MKTRNLTKATLPLPLIVSLIASSLSVGADPIEVPNAGFEHRDTYDPFPDGTDKYNQWGQESWRHFEVDNNGGPLRIWNPGDPADDSHLTPQGIADVGFGGNAPEGNYVVVVRSRYNDDEFHDPPQVRDFEAAVQLLPETFDPNSAYTLTVQVGRLVGSENYTPDWFGYAVQLAVGGTEVGGPTFQGRVEGGTVIAEDSNSMTVPIDTFVTSTVVYIPNPAHADLAGEPLQIRLAALEDPEDHSLSGWVAFDDVKLETGASFVPSFAISEINYSPANAEAGPTVDLTWKSSPGRNYSVESSTSLDGGWIELDDGIASEGEETTYTDTTAATGEQVFYRIKEN